MDLLEIGAIAILVSLIFLVVELRKNLIQNNIANSLLRAIELEKLNYKQMDENMAKVIAKAQSSYKHLENYEKVQFEAFVLQKYRLRFAGIDLRENLPLKLGRII